MSYILEETSCCGVDELDGLSKKPERILRDLCFDKYDEEEGGWKHAFLLFTDVTANKNGARLARYIKNKGLGITTTLHAKRNPNSGNRVKAWLWSVNEPELKKWFKSQDLKLTF